MMRSATPLFALALLCLTLGLPLPAQAAEHIVRVKTDLDSLHMAFEPKTLLIQPGDTVTWVNEAEMDHNMLTYPDGFPKGAEGFESPFMSQAGERWSHTFTVPGTYEYHCLPHLIMGMHGTVIVGEASKAGEFHVPSKSEVIAYRDKLLEYFDATDASDLQRAERFIKD